MCHWALATTGFPGQPVTAQRPAAREIRALTGRGPKERSA